jgi:hypothetical protein
MIYCPRCGNNEFRKMSGISHDSDHHEIQCYECNTRSRIIFTHPTDTKLREDWLKDTEKWKYETTETVS